MAFVLALAFLPLRRALLAAALLVLTALAVSLIHVPEAWTETVFVGCWLSVIASAALLHSPHRVSAALLLCAAANAGLWTGAVTAIAGRQRDLVIALPLLLLLLPGRSIVARDWGIGLKVVASWLTAVAILATMVSLTPTPGYAPDHME